MKIEDMKRELANLKRSYANELDRMRGRVRDAQTKLEGDRFSDHDAFNMAATAQNLAVLAGKIEQTANVIRWMEAK